ncbi:P-type cation-transporting ATPase [Diplogelasinospora grovesii]|uniref:P-type cation-transporting ATPase n=1 Tax=Diplogelasinospora grovesii TaxID=303347 RepID=A0AAN6N4F5_9PEZI|nr:P-type cation-transporting ATPase [Diplogelasinospora grovesii]
MGSGCCSGGAQPPAGINDARACADRDSDAGTIGSTSDDAKTDCCGLKEECDEQCIFTAATIACERHELDASINGQSGQGGSLSRESQFAKAFEKYKALLDTTRCICRSVLDEGMGTSCCSRKAAGPSSKIAAKSGCSPSPEKKAGGCDSQDAGCCSGGKASPAEPKTTASGCCSSAVNVIDTDDCCAAARLPDLKLGCSSRDLYKVRHASPRLQETDVEKDAGFEHVAMSVDGMTCNDCASKLERTLKAMPGTRNVMVNFIRGQADLDMDPSITNANDVLEKARAATGFSLNRLMEGGAESINMLVTGPSVQALFELDIAGVTDVTVLNKTAVRVSYDPLQVGARDLLAKVGELTTGLAPPVADPAVSRGQRRFYQLLLYTVLSTVMTIPVVALAWGETLTSEYIRGIVSFVLGSLVQALAVPVFYKPALRALFLYHALELDMLVVVGISAAYMYSIVAFSCRMAGQPLETAAFFETSTLLITLVMLGRLLASYARIRAVAAVSMRSLQSTSALVVEKTGEQEIDSRLLQYGDVFKVLPHCQVPTDGVVIEGVSEIDESMLTGESVPVVKQPGSGVIAGTVNNSGTLLVRLTRLPGKNTVTDIARLVEEASNSKPRIQDLTDRVASYFLPVVAATSVVVFIIWIIVGLKLRNESAGQSVSVAITYAIAVLAVSCPCALGLAVPMVLVIAGGIAARGGVVIKSAECTERSRKVTDVVFDKTGTLTAPDLDVLVEEYFSHDRSEAVGIARALVAENKHPVSVAVAKHLAKSSSEPAATVVELRSVPGAGVEARVDDAILRAGNPRWTGNEEHVAVRRSLDDGLTILLVTRNSAPLALFGLRTRVRPEAASVVSALRRRGITVHLVSGDQPRAVQAIAASVGIDSANAVAQHKPSQKRAYVASLMAEKKKYVLFCGDGTNDAAAVAQANVGAQISDSIISSSDVTRGAADVILLSGLKGIPFLLDVSRAAFRRIIFNFAWSATYNVLAISLAAGAFVKIRIPPEYAGAGELVSVLPVIAAAMSMLLLKL